MDMTAITTSLTGLETDVASVTAAVISIVLVYAGFRWIKRAVGG